MRKLTSWAFQKCGSFWVLKQSLTRGQKVQSRREREIWYSFLQFREEKEKPEIHFPSFERRKRNLKKGSPLSRRERERDFLFSSFERRKRIFLKSPISRREREIWNSFPQFWEEKEKFGKGFSTFEKRKRNGYYFLNIREEKENSYQAFWKVFPFSEALPIILWQPKL